MESRSLTACWAFFLAACGECPSEPQWSVLAEVADSGGDAVSGAWAQYQVNSGAWSVCEQLDSTSWGCGLDDFGEFLVRAEAPGHQAAQAQVTVEVEGDCGQVLTEEVVLELYLEL